MLGAALWVLGAAQAGKLVQFLPSPVMSGYLAAIGYVVLNSAVTMTAGCALVEVECLYSGGHDSDGVAQMLVAMGFGVATYVAQRFTSGFVQTMLIPFVLLSLTLLFALLRAHFGSDVLAAWTLQVDATPLTVWHALRPVFELRTKSWLAATRAAASTASVVLLPSAIGRLLVCACRATQPLARRATRDVR